MSWAHEGLVSRCLFSVTVVNWVDDVPLQLSIPWRSLKDDMTNYPIQSTVAPASQTVLDLALPSTDQRLL